MTQTTITGAGTFTNATATSTTMYGALGATAATAFSDTTETDFQMKFRQGTATLANLYVYVGVMTQSNNATVTMRQNTANSTMTTTITASTTGTYTDLTHTVSAADTDLIDYALTTGAGAGNIQITGLGVQLQTSSQVGTTVAGIGSVANNTSRFYAFSGGLSAQLEGGNSSLIVESVTLSNLQCVIPTNTSAGFNPILRKNTSGSYVNGNQTVTVGSSATGLFEDTTHTDSLASGNFYNLNKPAASASATLTAISCKYLGAVTGQATMQSGGSGAGLTSGGTRFVSPFGTFFNSTETQTQGISPGAPTISLMSTNVTANSSTSDMTVVFRNAAATKNQTLTVTASSTGVFQDVTHTDVLATGDKIDYQASGSNNSTNTFAAFAALATIAGGGGGITFHGLSAMGAGK